MAFISLLLISILLSLVESKSLFLELDKEVLTRNKLQSMASLAVIIEEISNLNELVREPGIVEWSQFPVINKNLTIKHTLSMQVKYAWTDCKYGKFSNCLIPQTENVNQCTAIVETRTLKLEQFQCDNQTSKVSVRGFSNNFLMMDDLIIYQEAIQGFNTFKWKTGKNPRRIVFKKKVNLNGRTGKEWVSKVVFKNNTGRKFLKCKLIFRPGYDKLYEKKTIRYEKSFDCVYKKLKFDKFLKE